jgi:hypothetical protein
MANWELKGEFFDSCTCDVTCPCNFNSVPTGNHCTGIVAIHVNQGKYGDTRLDGLNVVLVADLGEGNVWQGGWTAGVIMDEKANPGQRDALQTIMTGKAGGPPAMLASLMSKIVGLEFAPISFHYSKEGWGVSIGDKVNVETEAVKDASGNYAQILYAPVIETGSGPISPGKAKSSRIDAFGFKWDLSGKSSKHEPVNWKGP